MPMTTRQLNEATADYEPFLDGDEIVAVEEATPGSRSTCDICGERFRKPWMAARAAKQLVIVPVAWLQGSVDVRHYRLLVCRQGVACRKRRLEQIDR